MKCPECAGRVREADGGVGKMSWVGIMIIAAILVLAICLGWLSYYGLKEFMRSTP